MSTAPVAGMSPADPSSRPGAEALASGASRLERRLVVALSGGMLLLVSWLASALFGFAENVAQVPAAIGAFVVAVPLFAGAVRELREGRPGGNALASLAVLAAMAKHGVPRIVCMSNVGAGGSGTWFANHIVIPLFLRWLLPIIEDKDRMEEALRASSVEWVSVRLPDIVEGPERPLRLSKDGRGIGLSVTAASTAGFLLHQVTSSEWVRAAPSISN